MAVNRDPDAPIADFADVFVVGDLFEVGRALLAELRARAGLTAARADPWTGSILLPIFAFVALAAGLLVVFRGTGRIVARTREVESFRTRDPRPRRPASTRRSTGRPGGSTPSAVTRSSRRRSATR